MHSMTFASVHSIYLHLNNVHYIEQCHTITVITKYIVWLKSWVGRVTCWCKSNVFKSLRKSRALLSCISLIWILKFPIKNKLIVEAIWISSNDLNSVKKLTIGKEGSRYTTKVWAMNWMK